MIATEDDRQFAAIGRRSLCLSVQGNTMTAVLAALRGEPAIAALHPTNGRWDVMAEIIDDSLEAFDVTITRIRDVKGLADTETHILLSTHEL